MRIETSAPTRIDLAGGTIDIWPLYLFHPGAQTINAAISVRARARLESRSDNRIVLRSEDILAKGVDKIVCISVNDAFVMRAWGKAQDVGDKVTLVADGNGAFTNAMGLVFDGTGIGLGERSQRYAAIIDDGVVTALNVESKPGLDVSSAETILAAL